MADNSKSLSKKDKLILKILALLIPLAIVIINVFSSNEKKVEPNISLDSNNNGKTTIVGNKNQNSPTIIGNNNINGNNNNNKVIYNSIGSKNEYSMSGTSSKKLISIIENNEKIKFVSNSNNKIEVTFTGSLTQLDKNSNAYFYSGGNVIIKINQASCYEFKNFEIKEMRTTSKEIIENDIKDIIDDFVDKNLNLFSNKIIQCLKN